MKWNIGRKRYESRRVVSSQYICLVQLDYMLIFKVPTLKRAMNGIRRIGEGIIITPCQSVIEYCYGYGFKIVYPVGNMSKYLGIIPIKNNSYIDFSAQAIKIKDV